MFSRRFQGWLLCTAAVFALAHTPAIAGTTGVISGAVKNEQSVPVAAVKVTVASPSQTATGLTSATGFFSFLNLSPDTYTVTASKENFETAVTAGITVQADQVSHVDVILHPAIRTLGRITTTAVGGLVNRAVTGDLYAVNAQAIDLYQGSAGGAETLYSQNGVVGSLPGVIRSVGTGGGYAGNGSLSIRGGSNDQIGFELEGIPLNRAFDAANTTAFLTNGLASLEVYTGGEPANAGRSMSGYINEIIRRGSYPGGGDLTYVIGTPLLTNTVQADIYGGTPNHKFTYYASTLWVQAGYNFGDRSNLDNLGISVPANDPGCPAVNFNQGTSIDCTMPATYNIPISQGAWSSFVNPSVKMSDTVFNFNWSIDHQGLSDNLQALYVVGSTTNPFLYSGPFADPSTVANCAVVGGSPLLTNGCPNAGQPMGWPYGRIYTGQLGQAFDPANLYTLTWPSSGGSIDAMPPNYLDTQRTQSAIEKLSYTRALSSASFVRLYGYASYSLWNFDQATNAWLGDSFYDLRDSAGGLTLEYQNQINQQHLVKADVDYLQEKVLRYNYASNFPWVPNVFNSNDPVSSVFMSCFSNTTVVDYTVGPNGLDPSCAGASPANPEAVAQINGPFAYFNNISPVLSDVAAADTWRPTDRLTFDVGARFDRWQIPLMPLQITGPNGIAEIAQNQFGTCLHGYAYAAGENCAKYLVAANAQGFLAPSGLPGAANWTDVSGSIEFNFFSPRFGVTYSAGQRDVLRFAVGRYVQQPQTYGYEYRGAPQFGASDTVSVLNNFYDGLGFLAVHNIQPQDSTNYDFSWEHDFGHGISMKLSPYFRDTRNQILSVPINPLQPTFVTGFNFGAARADGVEFALRSAHTGDGWSGALAATYTNTLIRFTAPPNGQNYIATVNSQISAYNAFYMTNYPLFDLNGYYKPSLVFSPDGSSPSYDVAWVMNLNVTYRTKGWDFSPTFNYQSGNPYGDPLLFPDPNGNVTFGPDPYTKRFDGLGSLKGPWWLTMNFGVSHDLTRNVKASVLLTNVFTVVHNQGYPWEVPTSKQVISYADNTFYSTTPFAFFNPAVYTGESYYPYAASSINPYHQLIFSVSTKI